MRSLKEWADSIIKARVIKETREKKDAAVRFTRTLVTAGRTEALQPVADRINEAGRAWYSIGMKSFRNLTLSASDEEEVTVQKSCDICDHLYAINIKAWKIRSCDCAAAPCPKCSSFQIVDLDLLRRDKYGAYQ